MQKIVRLFLFTALSATLLLAGCTKKPSGPSLWIYTSTYNHVVQAYRADLEKEFPNVQFNFYQAGSENVATKVNSELLSGQTQADLIATSDAFWYEDLKQKGVLLAYDSPATKSVPAAYKDPEKHWVTSRLPMMVIAYNSDAFSEAEAPKSFADLTQPRFKDKIAMGSPLESGTVFSTVAMLSRKLGWDYFAKLRANGALAAGGNSAVMGRIESKERPVGIVLLENVIQTQRRNPKIKAVYPAEGVIPIPSPVAIFASTKQPELAKQVYDYFFSKEGMEVMRKGDVHSVLSDFPPPEGAKPLGEFVDKAMNWNYELIKQVRAEREVIKEKFSKVMLE